LQPSRPAGRDNRATLHPEYKLKNLQPSRPAGRDNRATLHSKASANIE